MNVVETDRLVLSRLSPDDAELVLKLLNDKAFLRFIGDKGVRTVEDARNYLTTGPIASYQRFGFGLYKAALRDGGTPIGICGLLKRDWLEDVDVGYALLPAFRGQGYGFEAAAAAVGHGRAALGLRRIVAVCSPDNAASIRLLEKLGMTFERRVRAAADEDECSLYASET